LEPSRSQPSSCAASFNCCPRDDDATGQGFAQLLFGALSCSATDLGVLEQTGPTSAKWNCAPPIAPRCCSILTRRASNQRVGSHIPILTEQLDGMRCTHRVATANQVVRRTVLLAAPTNPFGMGRMMRIASHRAYAVASPMPCAIHGLPRADGLKWRKNRTRRAKSASLRRCRAQS